MPIKKLQIKAGVNRENTRYTNEGGWYECNKIRFRQGFPEKIGGWIRISMNTFIGFCRTLIKWTQLNGVPLVGLGTDAKYYIEVGGAYVDITPIRSTVTGQATFYTTASGFALVKVLDTAHGAYDGDYVQFSSATSLGGVVTAAVLNQNYEIFLVSTDFFYIFARDPVTGALVYPNASDTGNGGSGVVAAYEIHAGSKYETAVSGWGGGTWSLGTWSNGQLTRDESQVRTWNHSNFGETLIAGVPGGPLYKWENSLLTRMTLVTGTEVPVKHNLLLVSDTSRFVFVFGCNSIGSSVNDPMLIRWSSQETYTDWQPLATNSAGSLRLSRGSRIMAVKQARQEILIWTDTSLYSLQFLGGSAGWGAQIVGENITIASQNSVAYANGVAFWMGRDKFYGYTGQTETLPCDLRNYIFTNITSTQYRQVFAGTNEAFNEVWWFYPTINDIAGNNDLNSYVVYNYLDNIWYYGTMKRTAWLDGVSNGKPIAASAVENADSSLDATQNFLVEHEVGVDDVTTGVAVAIDAFISSAEFDIDDGNNFAFVSKVIPDISFNGSTAENPTITMSLLPLHDSGSGYNNPLSVGGDNELPVVRTASAPIEVYTKQINLRVRGRQMSVKLSSTGIGVHWQMGTPRIDMRPDGRR